MGGITILELVILQSGDLEEISVGGIDQYIKNIITYGENVYVTLFGTAPMGKYNLGKEYIREINGKKFSFIPVSTNQRRPLSVFFLLNLCRYMKILKKYDLIFAQRVEFTLPFIYSKNKKKLVQIVHGSSKYNLLNMNKITGLIYQFCEKISVRITRKTYIVLKREEFGVPYYKKKYSFAQNKIGYAKVPVDTSVFYKLDKCECRKELGLPLDGTIIMFGGRVENWPKRVLIFPEILKNILNKYQNVYLMMLGNGTDKQILSEKIKEYNLQDHYIDIGYVSDRTLLAKYLNASDINMNISMFEGTCTSSLESVACGTPIVSTDAGDIGLFVNGGYNGIIIPNDTDVNIIKNCVDAIVQIISNGIPMNNDYLQNECKKAIHEMLDDLLTILSD